MSTQQTNLHFSWERAFAGNMARFREAKGISQNELAKQLSNRGLPFHQPTVQRVESGERSIRLDEACAIAEYFDVSLDVMMTTLEGNLEGAAYAVDRVKRQALTMAGNGQEDFGEFLYEFEILCIAFDEMLTAYDHKANAELTWVAAWIIKGGWFIDSWIDVERYAAGLAVKSGDWHEVAVTLTEAWNEYRWLEDEGADLWQTLPVEEQPWFLADKDPVDLHRWIIGRSSGEHTETP